MARGRCAKEVEDDRISSRVARDICGICLEETIDAVGWYLFLSLSTLSALGAESGYSESQFTSVVGRCRPSDFDVELLNNRGSHQVAR